MHPEEFRRSRALRSSGAELAAGSSGASEPVKPSPRGATSTPRPAAHLDYPALTCNDPADAPNGSVTAAGTVLVGD
ncbi:hypothetical protein BE11_26230 [Sorangium cellulosum]|nr:hypothetical protein BE11_26230 [Sorangium cellulosum]